MVVHREPWEVRVKTRKQYPMPPAGQIALSLNDVCAVTGFGMTTVRGAVASEALKARRIGKKIVVRREEVDEFLKALPSGLPKKSAKKAA